MEKIAKKAICYGGALSDQVMQIEVSNMKVELVPNWMDLEMNMLNDSAMRAKSISSDNVNEDIRSGRLIIHLER